MQTNTLSSPLHFGAFTLDPAGGLLVGNGQRTILRPKAQALLSLLARNAGCVVSKAELMDTGCPGIFFTEDLLTQSIREIRKVLLDDGQKLVRTVPKRGYLLASEEHASPQVASSQPVVAVLRFRNDTGDPGQAPIVDGFAEDVVNGLARFGNLTVLSRQSSFTFAAGDADDWAKAGARSGADFLVEGAFRWSQRRILVSVGLIDVERRVQVWGDRYEAEETAYLEIEEAITGQVVSRLAVRVEDACHKRVLRKSTNDLAAHELMLRGLAILRSNNPAEYARSCDLLRQANSKDPSNGLILAHLAFAMVMELGFGRSSRADLDRGLTIAARAIEAAPEEPTAHRVLSFVQMYRREYAAAEHHLRRALELNPFDADCVDQMGYLLTLRGRPVEAIAWLDRAVRLSPVHPQWYDYDRAFALYLLGDYRAAATAIERTPVPPAWMQTWLAACYAQLGDLATARAHAARIGEIDPQFSALKFAKDNGAAFEHAADNEHFAYGVLMALGLSSELVVGKAVNGLSR